MLLPLPVLGIPCRNSCKQLQTAAEGAPPLDPILGELLCLAAVPATMTLAVEGAVTDPPLLTNKKGTVQSLWGPALVTCLSHECAETQDCKSVQGALLGCLP